MPTSFARVDQDSASKPPVLHAGDITPDIMRTFKLACLGYFDHKEIPEDKQVRKILACLKDNRIVDWVSTERERLLGLTFQQFMAEFRTAYLDKNWEETTRRELLCMSQETSTFWHFAVRAQAKNSLLDNTASHLNEEKLRHQLEAGMNARLAKKCIAEKINKIGNFREWLSEVKRVDDGLADDRKEWEAFTKAGRNSNRKGNPLGEPSRRYNTGSTATTSNNTGRVVLPKLTENERKLLSSNGGCFKCRNFFVDHRSASCNNDFPAAEGYKTLMQSDVDRAKKARGNGKPVAAVTLASDDNDDERFIEDIHPVAAVLGSSGLPYAYNATNASTVIGDDDDGDTESDVEVRTVLSNREEALKGLRTERSAHMFWCCQAIGMAGDLPIEFRVLIDNGSHTVLI
jgi:hypothetical protein